MKLDKFNVGISFMLFVIAITNLFLNRIIDGLFIMAVGLIILLSELIIQFNRGKPQ